MSLVMKQRAWRCTGVASRSLALCVSHNNITGVLINRNNCWPNNAARKAIRALSTARLMTVSPKRMDHNIYYQISARYWVIRVSPTIIQLSVNRLCISHVASYDIILWIYAFILQIASVLCFSEPFFAYGAWQVFFICDTYATFIQ